jgi:hypothetical protein
MSISFDIQPRDEALERFCISREEFEAAVGVYIENLDSSNEDSMASPEEWQIPIRAKLFRLSELATVTVETDDDFEENEN